MEKEKCKKEVWSHFHHYPCSRYAVKDGYCWQHHPDKVAKRKRLSEEKFLREMDNSPWNKLQKAKEKIKELEKENDELKIQLREYES